MNPKEFVVPGAVKSKKVRVVRKSQRSWLFAQLEKSSISLFKIIPSGVMTVEPQYKLMAICNDQLSTWILRRRGENDLLVVSETTLPHLSAATKLEVP